MNEDRTQPYRCQVSRDNSLAVVKVGSSKFDCQIIDLSREDFHVRLPKGKVKLLRSASRIELHYHSERWLVEFDPQSRAAGDEIYLGRVRELTKVRQPSPWNSLFSLQLSKQTDPRFVLAMMVAFIFTCLALPGLGDKIGTAPRVKKSIHYVLDSIKGSANH